MSSLWTPDGEHPVREPATRRPPAPASQPPSPDPAPGAAGGAAAPDGRDDADAEQIEALRAELASTPAAVVITNHCLGMWELAALHLSQQPPQLGEAAIAIDALGAIVDRLEGRLGDDEATVRDALAQLRLAFVQIKSAQAGSAPSNAAAGDD